MVAPTHSGRRIFVLALDILFQLLDEELLVGYGFFDQIADGKDADHPIILQYG